MDYQNRAGSKFGGGGIASDAESAAARKERLRQLALETIDLSKDPYLLRNHNGQLECSLCFTVHINEGSYLAHTQGKKHQSNLARRAMRDKKVSQAEGPQGASTYKKFAKIGRPGYLITKIRDSESGQLGFQFKILFPEIKDGIIPVYRFMSSFEQRTEPMDKNCQYLTVAAEPYQTVSFKIPLRPIDEGPLFWEFWDVDTKMWTLQFLLK